MRLIGLAVVLTFGLTLAPLAAEAQQSGKTPRIGYLSVGSAPRPAAPLHPTLDGFIQGLRELGHVEGRTIVIEFRYAEGKFERFPDLAADLVRLKVNVIVSAGGPASLKPGRRPLRSLS